MSQRWNHNIHYHSRILQSVPPDATRALDIGCGEGMLTRSLRHVVPAVTGIDLDTPSLELAREYGDDISYVHGDFLDYPLELSSYDVVAAGVAANLAYRATKDHWEHPSPVVWPPPVTYSEMQALATELLPGATYRRHLLFRYSILWSRPA